MLGQLQDAGKWGRLIETAVGATLLATASDDVKVTYWREGNREVDFVLTAATAVTAMEVTTSTHHTTAGLGAFRELFLGARTLVVGPSGIPLEEFLSAPAGRWLA